MCASDHQQLAKLVHEAPTVALREDLERDLEALVKKMEGKAEQITKIQRHRAWVSWPAGHVEASLWLVNANAIYRFSTTATIQG